MKEQILIGLGGLVTLLVGWNTWTLMSLEARMAGMELGEVQATEAVVSIDRVHGNDD